MAKASQVLVGCLVVRRFQGKRLQAASVLEPRNENWSQPPVKHNSLVIHLSVGCCCCLFIPSVDVKVQYLKQTGRLLLGCVQNNRLTADSLSGVRVYSQLYMAEGGRQLLHVNILRSNRLLEKA